ncbi:MAG TPA: RnfABCDGE type electron transport complex subunit B [Firmicutes bacterium]|nr:RnfABCDGE type electron transport complex subunit B [Bacillota bacterium]
MLTAVVIMAVAGALFGALLAYAARRFAVPIDERAEAISGVLPGANCGGCGFAGCSGLAAAIAAGKAPVDACPVGGSRVAALVGKIMGMQVEAARERRVARVLCGGGPRCRDNYVYAGIPDCRAAAAMPGAGPKACGWACLGLGTCVRACPFGALTMGPEGLPVVDPEKCTACGKCVTACPHGCISLVPESAQVHVLCRNRERGPVVRKTCQVGCIACRACERVCPTGAIKVKDNCAEIDYSLCTNCGACVEKCPVHTIVRDFSQETLAQAS